jgi:mono/diheme cytochrome c family protein
MSEPSAPAAPEPQPATPSGRPRWWWWVIAAAGGVVLMLLALPASPTAAPEPELSEADLRKLVHDPAVVEQGRALWSNCVVCHGARGEGAQGPNLRDDFWLHGSDMRDLVRDIADGAPMARPVAMPSWRLAGLTPAQIRALAAYVASLHGSDDGKGKMPEGAEQPIGY